MASGPRSRPMPLFSNRSLLAFQGELAEAVLLEEELRAATEATDCKRHPQGAVASL
jgi:hypothetical protein